MTPRLAGETAAMDPGHKRGVMARKTKQISIIDAHTVIDGTVSFEGTLIVRGTVKGFLAGTEVVISQEGAVYADTRVVHLAVNGTFNGNLWASGELNVLANGKCFGRVTCKNLVVEAGGVLNADVTYGSRKGAGKVVDSEKRLLDQVTNMGSRQPLSQRENDPTLCGS